MIEVSGLTKYYGQTRAIYDLSFTIEQGRIAGFLGLNGAGKTTALKVLAGFLIPTSGNVTIAGLDLVASPEALRSRIGFLPEDPPLYDEMRVTDYLEYLGRLRSMSKAAVKRRVPEVIEACALAGTEKKPIGTLSLGYRKRVGLAQAIIHEPELLILDEPISGLDPAQIVEVRNMIRGLGGKHTILISSHILTEVEETCDKLLVLNDGELVAVGTEEEILEQFTASFAFDLVVRGDAAAAASVIAASDVVTEVVDGSVHEDLSSFSLELLRDEPEALVAALVAAGLGVRRLEPSDNPLESAFLALTGGKGGAA